MNSASICQAIFYGKAYHPHMDQCELQGHLRVIFSARLSAILEVRIKFIIRFTINLLPQINFFCNCSKCCQIFFRHLLVSAAVMMKVSSGCQATRSTSITYFYIFTHFIVLCNEFTFFYLSVTASHYCEILRIEFRFAFSIKLKGTEIMKESISSKVKKK